jgi:hypothetical protein
MFGSSGTVLVLIVLEWASVTLHWPRVLVSVSSMSETRSPHSAGSESRTFSPVCSFWTINSGMSRCEWPTRTASMPGTALASRADAFSVGRSGP